MSNRIVEDKIDNFLGLKFPLTNSPLGFFNPSILTKDQISANIRNLIMTRRGERLMRPRLGSNLHDLIFEKMDIQTITDHVNTYVKDELNTWMPYVNVVNISVTSSGGNAVSIKVKYTTDEQIYEELIFSIIGERSIG